MSQSNDHIAALIMKKISGEMSEEESFEWENWLNESQENQDFADGILNEYNRRSAMMETYHVGDRIWGKLEEAINRDTEATKIKIEQNNIPRVRRMNTRWLTAAASIILLLGIGIYWMLSIPSASNRGNSSIELSGNDIQAPSINRAVITTSDGGQIFLDSAENGLLANQGNVSIIKLDDGTFEYQSKSGQISKEIPQHTLTNPRGSKVVQMQLSDGTVLWLNAGSSITYPAIFSAQERSVSVTGEVYFEVAHNAAKPFVVVKDEVKIEVLGTHFNVNAYEDNLAFRITLTEGVVRVSSKDKSGMEAKVILKPGEQAVYTPSAESVNQLVINRNVNLDQVLAWKKGWFEFERTDLKSVMQDISRWYDLEVEFQGKSGSQKMEGLVKRDLPLSSFLKLLSANGVKYAVKGNKIMIMD